MEVFHRFFLFLRLLLLTEKAGRDILKAMKNVERTLSVIAARCHRSPFCHLRDIFPRPGEVFLMEGGFGNTAKFSFSPEAPSPRELSPKVTGGVTKED